MPQAGAALRRDLQSDLNPAHGANVNVVTLALTFEAPYDPEDLLDAFEDKYGEGKVVSDTDTEAGNNFRWRIIN